MALFKELRFWLNHTHQFPRVRHCLAWTVRPWDIATLGGVLLYAMICRSEMVPGAKMGRPQTSRLASASRRHEGKSRPVGRGGGVLSV